MHTPPSNASDPHTNHTTRASSAAVVAKPPRRKKWPVAISALALAAGLVGALGVWASQDRSLSTGLQALAWLVPAGQTLQFEQVQGSLRHGGQVGQVHWQGQGQTVQVHKAKLTLDWTRLWQGQLPLSQLHLQSLQVQADGTAPKAQALSSLPLPLKADLTWQIDQLQWPGGVASQLRGHYLFDGIHHRLELQQLDMAQGRYQGQMQLQAASPMALQAHLQGQINTRMPGQKTPIALQAVASLQGPLATAMAEVQLQASIQPRAAATASNHSAPQPKPKPQLNAKPMGLTLSATLRPWQTQAVSTVQLQAEQLDLSSLWPGAPQTQLSGQLQAQPEAQGTAWQLQAQLRNALAGPWDQHRLPLQSLDTRLVHDQGVWRIEALQLQWPQGGATAQGQWREQGWSGQAQIRHLQASQLHSGWDGPALSGSLKAAQSATNQVDFEALLQAAGQPKASGDALQVQGQWSPGRWQLQRVDLRWADAQLQGQGQWDSRQAALQGQWQWRSPGMSASLSGELSAAQGQGQAQLALQDAQRALQWLQRWPLLKPRLASWQAQGQAQLQADWQGGWAQAQTPIGLTLESANLQLTPPQASPVAWREGRLEISGNPHNLQAQLQGRLQWPQGELQIQSQLQLQHRPDGAWLDHWQGQWQAAQLQWQSRQAPKLQASLKLIAPMPWQWSDASTGLQWEPSRWHLGLQNNGLMPEPFQRETVGPAGQAMPIGPPVPATLMLERGQWAPAATPSGAPTLQGKALFSDVPVQWVHLLGGPQVQGDLMFKGQVSVLMKDRLNLQAQLERSSGRLLLPTESPSSPALDAGIKEAKLQLNIQDQDARLDLLWDSQQAGRLTAQLQSRVDGSDPRGFWSDQAPLSGRVSAQLPRIGAWAWLAPPGWRVQASLDAAFDVSGTRAKPHWVGLLQADQLSVRSAALGLEFGQGQLRARLQDQQMVLEQLTLQGAGAQGGSLSAQGQAAWTPDVVKASPLEGVRMDLRLVAKGLRVSNRADRRLSISGEVDARLQQGQMRLRGEVRADQASFILPEESTPTLSSDVVRLSSTPLAPVPSNTARSWMGVPDVQVMLDLGPDFQVQGHGLSTRLSGKLNLISNSAHPTEPRLTGQVNTVGGRFKAYGQLLHIEQGLLRFNGPFDNPGLTILALRPNLPQPVGVTVTGTALAPRMRLYAEPDMPDADKLAWLVLGRSPAAGGAESAVLQQAALVLLGGNGKRLSGELANALGIDEISVASGSRNDTTSPTGTASGTAITLGKRLSKDFYLIYESSLSGAWGSLFVFYDLSRLWTLRAQTGELNALDLIYTVRRD